MRLNEAIRAGIKLLPKQAFGTWINPIIKDSGCVLAAVHTGLCGKLNGPITFTVMEETLPELKSANIMCPACGATGYLAGIMIHLNDIHTWTREAIAEWADPRPELHVAMPSLTETKVESKEEVHCEVK